MRLEDPLYHASLTRKRKLADPSEGDYADRTKQRLEDSFEFDTSTSTSLDQVNSKNRLLWSIFKNEAVLESAGLKKKIIPILKSMEFIDLVKDRDYIDLFTNEYTTKLAKVFEPRDGEARHGIKIGIDEDMNSSLINADNDAKKILMDYYSKIASEGVRIPFRLKPIVDTKSGVKANQNYYYSEPTAAKPFYIRNHENKPVSGKVFNDLMKTIRWMDTFNSLMTGFEDIEQYVYENDDPPLKKNFEANLQLLNRAILDNTNRQMHQLESNPLRGNNSKSARSALKAATAAMKATKAVYQIKAKSYSDAKNYTEVDQFSDRQDKRTVRQTVNSMVDQVRTTGVGSGVERKLQGRGLRGAGVAPLKGVVRRGRTYNLNEIQGLTTPTAYIYRQLSSKYIRIPDLDNKTLVIIQPNRRKCGPKRVISDPLQSMIRTLAFKQHIDQAEYDKLSIDDKKLFKEILAITHLQYNFHDRVEDPLESLKAEYDKLKGELELGNDNLSIIKQLKSLSVDISAGSYGDNADLNVAELKAIIRDRQQKTQTAVWATDLDKSIRKVDASTQTEGGRVWAYTSKKKNKTVKTFAI
ncbi:unnamed protein product [Phytophthora lilii]|uniref:Unnamed protein product n=1 Tax=Phytophthora lilii TaxID=2077276 RepID=A0A9W6XLA4_9STRA|nr:unnamed protein product [Phytophthora lilii]